MEKSKNHISFNGTTTFNAPVQIAGDNIINGPSEFMQEKAKYTPEPKWRSPFTLAVLSWISVIVGLLALFPFGKMLSAGLMLLRGNVRDILNFPIQLYSLVFVLFVLLFTIFFSLRIIAKKQIRLPLFFNYAISGYGKRLTVEKIHISQCPQCGGKMKFYNRPVERHIYCNNYGETKCKITKRVPALECKRNREHWYKVDPAEDKVK